MPSEHSVRVTCEESRAHRRYPRGSAASATPRGATRTKDEFLAMAGSRAANSLSPIVTALQLIKLRGETGTERERAVINARSITSLGSSEDLLDVARRPVVASS